MHLLTEQYFDIEDYENFYENHFYGKLDEKMLYNAHRIFPRVAWALDIAKETGAKRVLDLGCLEGYGLFTLNKHAGVEGVGVDLSKPAIERAQSLAPEGLEFYQDTVENFMENYEGEKFDLITAFELLEHVKDPKRMLELIDTVKTDDADILISTPAFESPNFGKDDEKNKCHIRLYTLQDEDYKEANKYGNIRKATSIIKEVGQERIKDGRVISELINLRYR